MGMDPLLSCASTYRCYGNDSDGMPLPVHAPPTCANSDGMGRTGTFIAIHTCLEQMKGEGTVDVLRTIKAIRSQRPGLVQGVVRRREDGFCLWEAKWGVCGKDLSDLVLYVECSDGYTFPLLPLPPLQDQYKWCHEALVVHMDKFDIYGNFCESHV